MSDYSGYLFRYNGSAGEKLLPKTLMANITDANYNGTSGIVKTGSDGKISASLLPNAVFDGEYYYGTIDLTDSEQNTTERIYYQFNSMISMLELGRSEVGMYAIVSVAGNITVSPTMSLATGEGGTILDGGSAGSPTGYTFALQVGDRVIYDGYNTTEGRYRFAVIQTTYQDATTVAKGVVKLSDATTVTGMTGNDVITEGVLASVFSTSPAAIETGKMISSAAVYNGLATKLNLSGGSLTGDLLSETSTHHNLGSTTAFFGNGYFADYYQVISGTAYNLSSLYLGMGATAAKATADASGNVITSTYMRKISISTDGTVPSGLLAGDLYFDTHTA